MRVKELIEKIPSDTFDRVKWANKRYNQMIREAIRSETRLKLKPSGITKFRGVPVYVDDVGYPEEIGNRKISDKNRLASILSLKRSSLIKLRDSSKEIGDFLNARKNKKLEDFSNYVLESFPEIEKSSHSISETHRIADKLLRESEKFDLVEDILNINEDILGCYIYNFSDQRSLDYSKAAFPDDTSSKIKIYWGIIGLFANILGIETEDLTAVVIAHELAHAYTHLGFDIDQKRWDSNLFYDSDHDLKEGLAQYYTERVMKSLSDKIPDGLKAYQVLLKHQPKSYKKHDPWIKKSTPEALRNALIILRSKKAPVTLEMFDNALYRITGIYKRDLVN